MAPIQDWLQDVEGTDTGYVPCSNGFAKCGGGNGVLPVQRMLANGSLGLEEIRPTKTLVRRGIVFVSSCNSHWLATDERR